PKLLAYPFGEYTGDLAAIARELGFTAFGQQSGALGTRSDPRALPRFPMAEAFGEREEFAVKAASLPLPVVAAEPWDPVVRHNPPRLEVTLAPLGGNTERLACYAEGRRMEVEWLEPGRRFAVRADKPLSPPRGRYNCTAPAAGGRYYWYSHLWITPQAEPR
ncbi:MAG TPA: polysaccharide deacetylase, partial [Gammaproteobacteria bacterium]|nr:polysaccharide deacetylase [Gammaproteobacteria bacterium]